MQNKYIISVQSMVLQSLARHKVNKEIIELSICEGEHSTVKAKVKFIDGSFVDYEYSYDDIEDMIEQSDVMKQLKNLDSKLGF